MSDALARSVKLRIAASTLRSIEANGGLDAYLMKLDDARLSVRALHLKHELKAALAS